MDENTKIVDLLLEKSKEAFIMSVEIYNKPTIKYRVEGFLIFYMQCLGINVEGTHNKEIWWR